MDIGTAKVKSEEMKGIVHQSIIFCIPSLDKYVFAFNEALQLNVAIA